MLTGKLLSQLYPNNAVNINGFEDIESRYNNHFDVVASNIPFGDVSGWEASTKVRKRISKFGKPFESRRMQFDFWEAHSKVGEAHFKSRKTISKFGKPLKSGRSGFHFSESDSNIDGGDFKIRKPIQQFGRGFRKQKEYPHNKSLLLAMIQLKLVDQIQSSFEWMK